MTSPEALELEAVDAALAGRYVAPEHAELAELALLLRDDRPEPTPAWATHLDRRVEARFPARAKPPRFQWFRSAAPAFVLVALLVIPIGLATTLGGGSDDSGGGGSSGAGAGTATSGAAEDARSAPDAAAPSVGSDEALRPQRRFVQRSVSITLAAPRRQIDTVASDVGDITADVGGFVARSSITSSSGGSLILRVPSNRLDTTIQRLSKLAKVRELSRDSEDITAHVVSARDRLNDARAERKSLLKQLANAVTINETESIQARLRIVSGEIAAARNALRRVNNRAHFADVAVTLVTARGGAAGGVWTPGDAWHDALRVLEVTAGVLLFVAAVALPLLVAWLLGWLARRGVTRRRRERALDMA
jgi:Domain of unknown function (DUF4349)